MRPTLENIPQSKVPSPDTLLRSLDELAADNTYDFDYDNQIIAHEKRDAKKTYKMNTAYFGGAATIGNMIVFYENRDDNAKSKR